MKAIPSPPWSSLAAERTINKQQAIRLAVSNELARSKLWQGWRARIAAWRAAHPLPPTTGLKADKAFFDDLSGEI